MDERIYRRILIVEDEKYWQDILTEIAEEEGFTVTLVDSRASAKSKLEEEQFDVAIIDIGLPLSDCLQETDAQKTREGLWLLNYIHSLHKKGKGPFVIIASGTKDFEVPCTAVEYGDIVVAFLQKGHLNASRVKEALKKAWERGKPKEQSVAKPQIFLSYARADEEKVKELYQKLSDAGFKPWMDKQDILPGEKWDLAIERAIRRSDFFIACLSTKSVSKRGFVQKEFKRALDIWEEQLDSDIYLFPARLDDCEVPESLSKFQRVNLFESEDNGFTRLVKAIHEGIKRRNQ